MLLCDYMTGRKKTEEKNDSMTTEQLELKIETIIDRKLEDLFHDYFGDPEEGLTLKESFVKEVKNRFNKKDRELVPHSEITKKYGLS